MRISFIIICILVFIVPAATATETPNFIIFIADDVSWDDFGCYGNNQVQTPNIDRLADHGLRFTNVYLTAS